MTAPSTHRQLASHRHRPARRSAVTFIAETVPRPVRYSFLAALLICSVTHGPHLTQRLMNEDDVGCFTSPAGQSVAVGRWFHGLLRPIHQNITSPVVLGVLSILALAVASAAITWTFDVRSRRVALLTALVVTTTPAIAFSAGYFPGFDSFQGSFMFGALAVLVTVRLKWGFPLGAVFVMLSLASYQAGVNVAVAMAVVVLTRSILLVERSARDILALAGRLLGLGVLGGAMYWLSVRVSLRITGLALADYRGIQNVFDAFGPTEFIRRAKYATKTFISFFYGGYYAIPRLLTYAAILLGVSMVVLIIARAVRKKISPLRTIAALAILTLVPVALNFSGVFQVDDTSYIGSQAFTLAYVFVLVFVEESAIAVRLPFARGAAALLV
ncbi:MAG: glucosyltransferase domain-containing protein, partial [Micrococcales bacterium]|nr:glucosyltransferase domain-containing protein [Micrococcales bacterium]